MTNEYKRLIGLPITSVTIDYSNVIDSVNEDIPIMLEATWHAIKDMVYKIEQDEATTLREVGEATGDDGDGIRHNPVYDAAAQKLKILSSQKYAILGNICQSETIKIYDPNCKSNTVMIGCKVQLYFHSDGETETYMVGSSWDAKVNRKFISIASPLGKAILGSKRGDTVTYTPENSNEQFQVTVKKILPLNSDTSGEHNG